MKKIYFIGINGIGMSGLAKIMKCKGYKVEGSDLSRSYVTDELESMGIIVHNQHSEKNLEGKNFDMIIASSAIKKENPEYIYALENGIKVVKRGELLAMLLNEECGIAVAGTHGKTTTSSMAASVMLSLDPTIVIGGILPEIGSNAKPGKSNYFIAEADESDNSFLYMNPTYSIITNIEADHLENHGSLENIIKSFSKFIDQTSKEILICSDCEILNKLVSSKKDKKIIRYSMKDKTADIYVENVMIEDGKTSYDVVIREKKIGNFTLYIPGEHNILNSLPVIYLALEFGLDEKDIEKAFGKFRGSKRRYEILYSGNGVRVIDDYAHHPTEIKATLQGATSIEKDKITVIFQPHRYSRVNFLLKNFKDAFEKADELILLPIYSAGEKNIFKVTIEDLQNIITKPKAIVEKNPQNIDEMIMNFEGNRVFMFMGAGDISKIAHRVAEKLEGKYR
ncbi:UDP-N-acetylmuramate--L-alanine ligase [Fusobacterium necrogenes]|uniref:UDP-N-acetylmuramate--L-alanine ligase n=1 Tax=Fusobacterium necrogenes TaxID=858 RepID=A0A377GYY8_9FUSO|nr:UDP-N-acetylmuramate--L-alanine ligase [Fusobacterium necrogenes]STO32188.1 UDP-N-acetylmuramate--L-alanine ligase [Fusobacterium necrogenes]